MRELRSWGITCVPRCFCVILAVITAKPISISENIVCPAGKHTSETQRNPRTKPLTRQPCEIIHSQWPRPAQSASAELSCGSCCRYPRCWFWLWYAYRGSLSDVRQPGQKPLNLANPAPFSSFHSHIPNPNSCLNPEPNLYPTWEYAPL